MAEDSKFKKLWENNCACMYTLVLGYKGFKFRIHCEHSNGIPMGFNYKCCLDIMTSDGDWRHLVDNKEVGADWRNSYYANDEKIPQEYNNNAITAFKEYVEKVY